MKLLGLAFGLKPLIGLGSEGQYNAHLIFELDFVFYGIC